MRLAIGRISMALESIELILGYRVPNAEAADTVYNALKAGYRLLE